MNQYFPDRLRGRQSTFPSPFSIPKSTDHGISPTTALRGSLPTLPPTPRFTLSQAKVAKVHLFMYLNEVQVGKLSYGDVLFGNVCVSFEV